MSAQYSIPIAIALLAFFIADQERQLFSRINITLVGSRDRTQIRERLFEIGKGREENYENFRIYQLVLAASPLLLIFSLLLLGAISPLTWILLATISFISVYIYTERELSQRVKDRREKIEAEFPALIEMLTLAIGAGESPINAMKRISSRASGHLAEQFRLVIEEVERGKPFQLALDHMSHRLNSLVVRRFVDSLIISMTRGTPLVDTLTHASAEARNAERSKLLTAAGKSEITMMIPVVFLILPISILFALFPSLNSLAIFT